MQKSQAQNLRRPRPVRVSAPSLPIPQSYSSTDPHPRSTECRFHSGHPPFVSPVDSVHVGPRGKVHFGDVPSNVSRCGRGPPSGTLSGTKSPRRSTCPYTPSTRGARSILRRTQNTSLLLPSDFCRVDKSSAKWVVVVGVYQSSEEPWRLRLGCFCLWSTGRTTSLLWEEGPFLPETSWLVRVAHETLGGMVATSSLVCLTGGSESTRVVIVRVCRSSSRV